MLLPSLLPLTVTAVALSAVGQGLALWLGGALFGGSLVLWLYVADAVPVHVEPWGNGAAGSGAPHGVLGPLAPSRLDHHDDLELPGAGNIDHLAVGSPGVFVLDSKVWNGVVTVDQDGATITPREDPGAAWLARGNAWSRSRDRPGDPRTRRRDRDDGSERA